MFHPEYYNVKIIQTEEELYSLASKLSKTKIIYFDTETSGLRVRHEGADYIVGWTFAVDDDIDETVYYIPVRHEFEGAYEMGHIDWNKIKLNPNDFPEFTEEAFRGNWFNVDPTLVLNVLKPILEGNSLTPSKILVAHNISFDFHVLADEGIDILSIFKYQIPFDTMVAFHTIDEEGEKKLESIIRNVYGIEKSDFSNVMATVTLEEKKSMGLNANSSSSFQHSQIPIGGTYSSEDVWFMKQYYFVILQALKDDGENQYDLFMNKRMKNLQVCWKMERRGMRVDVERCKEMSEEAKEEMDKITYRVYEITGVSFNIGSGQQVGEILFGHKKKIKDKKTNEYRESYNAENVEVNFHFQPISWTTGGKNKDENLKNPQVTAEVLEELLEQKAPTRGKNALTPEQKDRMENEGREVIKLLLRYSKLKKLYTSFMIGLMEQLYSDGRAHPSFNICGTDSWRLSCDHPNLQQLPKPLEGDEDDYEFWKRFEIRELFIPDDPENEVVIAGDWSNLEKRISAHVTKDEKLIKMFNDNLDGHGLIATIIFPELADVHPNDVKKLYPHLRQIGKKVGFAIDYGGTAFAVSRNLKISKEEAQVYIDRYFEGFWGIAEWGVKQKKLGARQGYVTTLFGHKRHLSGITSSDNKIRFYYERLCLNSPIQGSAADIATLAQIAVDDDPIMHVLGATLRIQVHDELVCVAPKKYAHIAMARLKYLMETCLPFELVVPLISNVDFGANYAEAK